MTIHKVHLVVSPPLLLRLMIFKGVKMKNDPDASLAPRTKTLRFKPNVPQKKNEVKGKVKVKVKSEPLESKDDFVDKELLSKLHNTADSSGAWVFRNGKKVPPAQVTFADGDTSKARTFGEPKSSVIRAKNEPQEVKILPSRRVAEPEEEYEYYDDVVEELDYSKYYRTTLPLTKPELESTVSGSLAIKEFGDAAICPVEEPCINAARELGLMKEKEEPELIFFQLPANLPLWKRPAAAKAENKPEDDGKPAGDNKAEEPKKGCRLDELPGGLMGKLRVYKSGIIKLKLGDSEFDVTPAAKAVFAQEVAAINTRDQHCCILGEITKRAVITPDVDSLLDTIGNLNMR